MQPFLELLRRCVENHTFDSGDPDCKTVLDQLFRAYQESHESDPPDIRDSFRELDALLGHLPLDDNNTDNDAVKAAFEDLYQRMHGMPLREMDRIVDAVCTLCREHEKAGFVEGVRIGLILDQETN